MKVFEDLASELHTAWMKRGRDELAFPELAHSSLERFASASAAKPDDLFYWLVATDQLPRQFDPRSTFGNLRAHLRLRCRCRRANGTGASWSRKSPANIQCIQSRV